MLHMVSEILGCRLLGSPIWEFFSYTSFILFRASLYKRTVRCKYYDEETTYNLFQIIAFIIPKCLQTV